MTGVQTCALPISKSAWVKYGLAWTASRLQWCECILAIDQEWAMFSPNVRKHNYATRARLRFEDGAEFTIRPRSEPEDLTSYSRWKQGKTLGIDRFVASDHGRRHDACVGYCNFLAHRYPSNSNGSPLRAIVLYEVHFKFVPAARPWSRDEPVDTQEFLRDQIGRASCRERV